MFLYPAVFQERTLCYMLAASDNGRTRLAMASDLKITKRHAFVLHPGRVQFSAGCNRAGPELIAGISAQLRPEGAGWLDGAPGRRLSDYMRR